MQTTLRDFTRFLQAVIAGDGLPRSARELMLSPQIQILSKQQFPTLSTATTEQNKGLRLSYGLGWGLYWSPYGKAFFKEGHDEGFRNYAVAFEKPGTGIVILTNSSNGEGIFKELLENIDPEYVYADHLGGIHTVYRIAAAHAAAQAYTDRA